MIILLHVGGEVTTVELPFVPARGDYITWEKNPPKALYGDRQARVIRVVWSIDRKQVHLYLHGSWT